MGTKVLVDTLAVVEVKAKAFVKRLALKIVELEVKTIGDTLDKDEGKALVFVLADTFAEADAKN